MQNKPNKDDIMHHDFFGYCKVVKVFDRDGIETAQVKWPAFSPSEAYFGEGPLVDFKPILLNEEKNIKFGSIVYHVANPDVRGIVLGDYNSLGTAGEYNQVWVSFDEPVSFSGNQTRKSSLWVCSSKLLWPTHKEAKSNNNPDLEV